MLQEESTQYNGGYHHPASPPSYPEGIRISKEDQKLGPRQVVGQPTEPQLLNDGGSCGLFIHSFSYLVVFIKILYCHCFYMLLLLLCVCVWGGA